ncbi:hypothetical protein Sste5346_010463 [Sporothrix stenoceras]|uniref:HNH nuclease domain-containing protein n=1 Tax=Sporothrix stenoceras TaxID=5173 RepID=A0ABR3YI16_9PEZI
MAEPIPPNEAAPAMTDVPIDADTLLTLIVRMGIQDSGISSSASAETLSMDIVKGLLLPLKAIAECSSAETGESDSGSDSDSGSGASSYGATPRGFRGPRRHTNPRPVTADDPVWTYIFPPSPLADIDKGGYINDVDDTTLSCTARVAQYLTKYIDEDAVTLLKNTAHDPDANIVTLPRTWSDSFRRYHATVVPHGAHSVIVRDDSKEGEDEHVLLANMFLTSDDADFVVRPYTDGEPDSLTFSVPSHRPLRELLYLHARITWLLWRSRAGPYIDTLLADNTKSEFLSSDGGTMADVFMQLRLEGWYRKPKRQYDDDDGSDAGSPGIWIDHARFVDEEHEEH